MNLLNYLKEKIAQLQKLRQQCNDTQDISPLISEEDNIEIVILNHHSLFEKEQEILKKGELQFLENGNVETLEEGIITTAVILRGLRYKETELDENSHIKIIFEDVPLRNSRARKLS